MTHCCSFIRFAGIIGAVMLFVTAVSAQNADDVLARLRVRYDAMESMRASFSQSTSSTYLDDTEHFYGDIVLQGDSFRIEMADQTIVTNTVLTWIYNRSENQVLINGYEIDETTFSLSTFLAEFDTAYEVASYERVDGLDAVKLLPIDPFSAFRSVTLWASDDIVVRLHIVDMNDVEMQFDLTDIEFNPEIPEGTFLFSVPDGVDVIDLREN